MKILCAFSSCKKEAEFKGKRLEAYSDEIYIEYFCSKHMKELKSLFYDIEEILK